MRSRLTSCLALMVAAGACSSSRRDEPGPARPSAAAPRPSDARAEAAASSPASATGAAAVVAPVTERADPPGPDEPLEGEAPEANPRSERVKLKLWVTPVDATVSWGAKKLGVAGKTPLELERPRGSGPMDLVVRAPGYLPHHARLFTDRDDRLTVRLVRTEDAPGLMGYRRTSAPIPAANP